MKQVSAIVGDGVTAAALALGRILKKNRERWIVLDYTGRLGLVLPGLPNNSRLKPQTTTWIDLANRSTPTGVFKLQHSPFLASLLLSCLKQLRSISGFAVSDIALQWVADAGVELSKQGNVTLASLLRSMSTPNIRSWFFDSCSDHRQLELAGEMLVWCLGFPAVYAYSEGFAAKRRTSWLHGKHKVVWLEMLLEHFEYFEHRILTALVSTSIALQLHEMPPRGAHGHRERITVVHGFPPAGIEKIHSKTAEWEGRIHHLYVHRVSPVQKLRPHVLHSIQEATSLWVTPLQQKIVPAIHGDWLKENECMLINRMNNGQILLKDTRQGKCIVAKVYNDGRLPLPHGLRQASMPDARGNRPCRLQQHSLVFPNPQPLYNRIYTPETLQLAWMKVKKGRKDSHGIDGVTIAAFAKHEQQQLAALIGELKNRTYRPRPLRRVYLPKPDGSQRAIGINCIRDKVVQSACLSVIEPLYEPDFSQFSFAFRPGRNAHQAINLALWHLNKGYTWVVTADIQKCFDSIDQQLLLEMLEKKIGDQELLNLIQHWLTVDVIEFRDVVPVLAGVPQGAALSPFLANVYLDSLDKFFEKSGYSFIRYADDLLIFTYDAQGAQEALTSMELFLRDSLHLALKPAKTQYVPKENEFDFLGFTLQDCTVRIQDKKLEKIGVVLESQIRMLGRQDNLKHIFECMSRLNSLIRGIRNYFSLQMPGKINSQLQSLDAKVEQIGSRFLPPATCLSTGNYMEYAAGTFFPA